MTNVSWRPAPSARIATPRRNIVGDASGKSVYFIETKICNDPRFSRGDNLHGLMDATAPGGSPRPSRQPVQLSAKMERQGRADDWPVRKVVGPKHPVPAPAAPVNVVLLRQGPGWMPNPSMRKDGRTRDAQECYARKFEVGSQKNASNNMVSRNPTSPVVADRMTKDPLLRPSNARVSTATAWLSLLGSAASRRRPQTLDRLSLAYQWKLLRMLDGLHREIDVEVWPIQMMRARKLHIRDRPD